MSFISIHCQTFNLPNCKEYSSIDNRTSRFREIACLADFIVSPARDDCQPGPAVECGSLGLLPIVSEYAGHVLSFPRRLNPDDLNQCVDTLYEAQAAESQIVDGWQMLNARFIEQFHRPKECEALLEFYIKEACSEFYNDSNPD
jgi:hypothetical protein